MENDRDKQTVLIVDDEPLIRLYVRGVLEDAGYCAKEASNAQDALKLIQEDGITLLVTDIDMPERWTDWPWLAKCGQRGRTSP